MKNHLGQWANDYSFARVNCGRRGHGKSTSPTNLITDRDAFFYMAALGQETCAYCLREAIAKTPKRYKRVLEMAKAGASLDEVRAETARRKVLKDQNISKD